MKLRDLWVSVSRRWWWWLAGLGIGVRLVYVLLVGKPELSWGDEVTYDLLARNLTAGHGYCFVPGQPSMLRAPLYPFFMAGLYALCGDCRVIVLIVQALAGGLSALLVVRLGQRLFQQTGPSIVAGCLFACHPLLIFATGLLYPETIYLSVLLLFTLACLEMVDGTRQRAWAVVSGLLLGISVLIKPNLLLLPLALLLWMWFAFRRFRQALLLSGLLALTMVAVVLPWTLRNYRLSGVIVPVSANGGLNLWQGNHPEADGAAYPLSEVDPLEGYSETARDAIYRQWALHQIRSDPARFLALVPRKIGKFFAALETSNRGRFPLRLGRFVDWGWAVFLGVAAWGVVRTVGNSERWGLIYMLILYPVGVSAVFYGATRYGMVAYPYLFLLASDPLVWIAGRLSVVLKARGGV